MSERISSNRNGERCGSGSRSPVLSHTIRKTTKIHENQLHKLQIPTHIVSMNERYSIETKTFKATFTRTHTWILRGGIISQCPSTPSSPPPPLLFAFSTLPFLSLIQSKLSLGRGRPASIHIHIHIHIHIRIHIHIHRHIHRRIHTYTYTDTYTDAYTHTHTQTHTISQIT